jgi:hypothetical protein
VVRVEVTTNNDEGTVGGTFIDRDNPVDVTLETTQILPEATLTKISLASAGVDITNITPDEPPDVNNQITVDGDVVIPGETKSYGPYDTGDSHVISGTDETRQYQVTITCTSGVVVVSWGSHSIVLGELGTMMTNGTYTVGNVEADPGWESGPSTNAAEWAYAGWSLIIIYSSPSEEPHQLFLYDDFTYVDSYANNFPLGYLDFPITGFLAPYPFNDGILTCFVGEGDDHYNGDYIECNGNRLPVPGDPYDGVNPQDDVWNGKSSGLGGQLIDGVDIDTFDVSTLITPGDTSAVIKLDSGVDVWSVVFIFLSFDTIPAAGTVGTSVSIITFNIGM